MSESEGIDGGVLVYTEAFCERLSMMPPRKSLPVSRHAMSRNEPTWSGIALVSLR